MFRPPHVLNHPHAFHPIDNFPMLNKLSMTLPVADESSESESEFETEFESRETEFESREENQEPMSRTINQLTLDLMVNHKYLAKSNPILRQQRQDLHHKIIKHKRDILKIIHECFRHLEEGDIDPLCQNNLMSGFEEFAKLTLIDIEHAKLSEVDQLFAIDTTPSLG